MDCVIGRVVRVAAGAFAPGHIGELQILATSILTGRGGANVEQPSDLNRHERA
jgi:hypothetical protein